MPWTDITRRQYNREWLRYPSDLSDREWDIVAPEVMNAILHIAVGGIQWRMPPKDFPPASLLFPSLARHRTLAINQSSSCHGCA